MLHPTTPAPAGEHAVLIKLANTRMPFGQHRGRLLIDLPEPYVVWFRGQGYPAGELGTMMASLYEIKANGLEELLRPLVRRSDKDF
jgi:uncharacterized protein